MKKIIIMLTFAVGSTLAIAQQPTVSKVQATEEKTATNEQKAEHFAGRWMKELGLTSIQKDQVYQAKLTQLNKIKALDEKYPGENRKDHQAEYKPVQDEFMASMKGILSAEQFEKWQNERKHKNGGAVKMVPQK